MKVFGRKKPKQVLERPSLTTSLKYTNAHPAAEQQPPPQSPGMEYPSGHFESAVQAVSPPNFLLTPSLFTEEAQWKKDKALPLCKHCLAIARRWCVTNPALVPDPKHSTIRDCYGEN